MSIVPGPKVEKSKKSKKSKIKKNEKSVATFFQNKFADDFIFVMLTYIIILFYLNILYFYIKIKSQIFLFFNIKIYDYIILFK